MATARETQTIMAGNSYADGVTLDAFGPIGSCFAAEVVDDNGYVVYRVNEPLDRAEHVDWADETEQSFRATVRQIVRGAHDLDSLGEDLVLVFDPERDQAEEETV